jgi:hypothetical protein
MALLQRLDMIVHANHRCLLVASRKSTMPISTVSTVRLARTTWTATALVVGAGLAAEDVLVLDRLTIANNTKSPSTTYAT